MSIDKAAIVIGAGMAGVRRIPADDSFRMRPDLLREAIAEDRKQGWLPFCVVATLGTTSSTSMDPAAPLADICADEGLWLHIDAAYAGAAAIAPEMRPLFTGWERADSIVFNPHKWLFTPFDASLLLFRSPDTFREAFSLVPEYIKTPVSGGAHNFNEYGIQLGRRFRALKLWMQIRYFGADGIAARIREHCRMAKEFASWIEADPDWELLAPVPFSVVCFRRRSGAGEAEAECVNQEIMARVNRSGRVFLSHTKLRGKFAIRLALGNPRTTMDHVRTCWTLLQEAGQSVAE